MIIIVVLRLLGCPLGLGSIILGLKIRTRIIKVAVGLIPRLTIVTTVPTVIPTVVPAGLVAVRATSRLGRRGCSLMHGHSSGLVCQISPELQPILRKIKETVKFRIILVSILPLETLPEANFSGNPGLSI